MIPETVSGTNSLLRAASLTQDTTPLRFVYTSSTIATGFFLQPSPDVRTSSSWNDLASELAWAPPPYAEERKWAVYAASKTESEKACFKFAEELQQEAELKKGSGERIRRRVEVNSVVPSVNFGPQLHESQSSETLVWIRRLIEGDMGVVKDAGPPRKLPPSSLIVYNCSSFHFPEH